MNIAEKKRSNSQNNKIINNHLKQLNQQQQLQVLKEQIIHNIEQKWSNSHFKNQHIHKIQLQHSPSYTEYSQSSPITANQRSLVDFYSKNKQVINIHKHFNNPTTPKQTINNPTTPK